MDAISIITLVGIALGVLGTAATSLWYASRIVSNQEAMARSMSCHLSRMERLEIMTAQNTIDIARLREHVKVGDDE